MPYIDSTARLEMKYDGRPPKTAGELNYSITMLINAYLTRQGESYATYNELIGVLECAKLELYRRQIAGYEDLKMGLNGDVYTPRNSR